MFRGSAAIEASPSEATRRVPATAIDQIMAIGTVAMDQQARTMISFAGHLEEGRLARAMRLTFDAEPLLSYRFVGQARRPYWEKVDEGRWSPYFEVLEGAPADPRLAEFMVEPVLPEHAPQVRARLFRSENDSLCIRSNHVAMDGGGALRYLFLLASIYRQLGKDPSFRPTARAQVRLGPRQVIGGAGPVYALGALLRTRPPGAQWGIPRTGDDLGQQVFLNRRIGPERLELLRAYARCRKVTMNDMVLTALCRSLFSVLDPPEGKRLRVEVPTDLRRYVPGAAGAVTDLSAVYFLSIDRRSGERFDDTLARVHEDIARNKKRRTELGQMLLLELVLLPGAPLVGRMKSFFHFEPYHPALSNLGTIDPPMVSFGGPEVTDLQLIGPTIYPPNLAVHMSTYQQTMSLGINCCSSAMDIGMAERILDLLLDELPTGSADRGYERPSV